jgi:hypothetical protein
LNERIGTWTARRDGLDSEIESLTNAVTEKNAIALTIASRIADGENALKLAIAE